MEREIFLFKNLAENEAGRLVLDLFLFFKKLLHELMASGLQHSVYIYILIVLNLSHNKNTL